MQRVRVLSEHAPVQRLGDTQMAVTPKFRLGITATPPQPATSHESDVSRCHAPLIPGLPDEIALACLLRLPFDAHPACSAVCRRWRTLLASAESFFNARSQIGLRLPWLFVFASHGSSGKARWQALDLANLRWHPVPAMPCRVKLCPRSFRSAAVPDEGALLVCGGMVSDADCPLDVVLKFEMRRNRWSFLKKMLTPRAFFAGGFVGGLLYVAGGSGAELSELESAEVLDPVEGRWRSVKSMEIGFAAYDAAVVGGRLLLTEGWVWPFLFFPRGQVYDPGRDSWSEMTPGLREGWTGSSAVLHDRLFVLSEHEDMRLKVYNVETDEWENVAGSPLPQGMCRPFCITSFAQDIYVVCHNLRIAVGRTRRVAGRGNNTSDGIHKASNCSFSIHWEEIEAPGSFQDFSPSACELLLG